MIIKIKCYYCQSEDLKLHTAFYGKGTDGEREERCFKCNSCGEELLLDDIIIEEI